VTATCRHVNETRPVGASNKVVKPGYMCRSDARETGRSPFGCRTGQQHMCLSSCVRTVQDRSDMDSVEERRPRMVFGCQLCPASLAQRNPRLQIWTCESKAQDAVALVEHSTASTRTLHRRIARNTSSTPAIEWQYSGLITSTFSWEEVFDRMRYVGLNHR